MTQVVQEQTRPEPPQIGEIFELTSNSELYGLRMVKSLPRTSTSDKWIFTGTNVPQGTTKRFKLVEFGYQPDLSAVVGMYAKHGKIPEGVWMRRIYETFKPDYKGWIGVPDTSWVRPEIVAIFSYVPSRPCFPAIDGYGNWHFFEVNTHFLGDWRWLVEV